MESQAGEPVQPVLCDANPAVEKYRLVAPQDRWERRDVVTHPEKNRGHDVTRRIPPGQNPPDLVSATPRTHIFRIVK